MQHAQLPTAQKQAIPPEVSQLAKAYQVGAVVNEYQSDAVTRMLFGLVLSVFGGGGTLLLIYLLVTHPINDGALGILFTLLLLGYGISLCRRAWHNRRARVYLCAEGVMRLEESRVEAMRWDQVAVLSKVFGGGGAAYLYSYLNRYMLLRIDGTALLIDKAFRRFDELGRHMEEEVTKRLLPGALAAYEGGSTLTFGPISVNAWGFRLQQGQKTLPWAELKELKTFSGRLIIGKKGAFLAWGQLQISGIPNVCVLLALLMQIAPDKTRGG